MRRHKDTHKTLGTHHLGPPQDPSPTATGNPFRLGPSWVAQQRRRPKFVPAFQHIQRPKFVPTFQHRFHRRSQRTNLPPHSQTPRSQSHYQKQRQRTEYEMDFYDFKGKRHLRTRRKARGSLHSRGLAPANTSGIREVTGRTTSISTVAHTIAAITRHAHTSLDHAVLHNRLC